MAQISMTSEKLKALTIAELKELAAKNSIQLKAKLKADIVKELSRVMKPAMKPVKKTAKKAVPKGAATRKIAAKKAAVKKPSPKKKAPALKGTVDLASMTVAELRAMADKNSIVLKNKLKADILKELEREMVSAMKAEKEAPPKKAAPKKSVAKKATVKKSSPKKEAPEKPKAESAQREPAGPSGQKARTSLPVGTVPPRSPEPGVTQSALKRAQEPWPWKPKTPETKTENWASAIPVEPGRIFVSWDIEESSVPHGRRLVMRAMDITDTVSDGDESEASFIQVPVRSLSGGMFVNVSRGHSYRAVIGTMGMGGDFLPLIITEPVTTPSGLPSEGESILEDEHFLFNSPESKGAVSSY